jgi:hypothetical protein
MFTKVVMRGREDSKPTKSCDRLSVAMTNWFHAIASNKSMACKSLELKRVHLQALGMSWWPYHCGALLRSIHRCHTRSGGAATSKDTLCTNLKSFATSESSTVPPCSIDRSVNNPHTIIQASSSLPSGHCKDSRSFQSHKNLEALV